MGGTRGFPVAGAFRHRASAAPSRSVVISVPTMILPKVRDPRFVTIRRGGTLTDSDHQLLALWAASCAEHVLDLFESAQPEDPRPRQAIEQARAWVRGEITMTQARTAAGHAMAAARDLRGAARHAAYAAGQAGGRRTRRRARARCGRLCDQGRTCCRAGRRGRERRATRVPVAARPAPGGDSRARPRRPAVAERHLLVGVRLLSARQPPRPTTRGGGPRPTRAAARRRPAAPAPARPGDAPPPPRSRAPGPRARRGPA